MNGGGDAAEFVVVMVLLLTREKRCFRTRLAASRRQRERIGLTSISDPVPEMVVVEGEDGAINNQTTSLARSNAGM